MTYETVRTPRGLTVHPSGAEPLAALLDRFFSVMRVVGAPIDSHLGPGLDEDDVRERLSSRGLSAPDELIVWFGAFNGVRFAPGERPFSLFPSFNLHSLENALYVYDSDANTLGLGLEAWNWNPEWLRLGDPVHSLVVRCGPDASAPPLVRSIADEHTTQTVDPTYQVVSLCTPVAWWIEDIESGVYQWQTEKAQWSVDIPPSYPRERLLAGML